MSGAGLTYTIHRLMEDVRSLWPQSHGSAVSLILARKCSLIATNIKVLEDFLTSAEGAHLSDPEKDGAMQVSRKATRAIKLAAAPRKQSQERTERELIEAAGLLRQLGETYSLGMEWDLCEESDNKLSIVKAAAESVASTSIATAFSPGSAANAAARPIVVQIHVWYRGNHSRIITDLTQPDHSLTKQYATNDSINVVLKDLSDEGYFPIESKIGCYVRSDTWHRFTHPGLRWLRQKPHTRTMASLPSSIVHNNVDITLDVVVDMKPFIILVQHTEQTQEASGIVVHPCDQDNLDSIVSRGLRLENGLFYYQHLDGSGPQPYLAQQFPKPFKCDWCILPGGCPTQY